MDFIQSLLRRGFRGLPAGFLGNLRWQYIATIGGAVLGGFYAVVISRALGLAAFGTFSLCLSIATLVFSFTELRLHEAVIRFTSHYLREGSEEKAYATIKTLFAVDLMVRLVAFLLAEASAFLIAEVIVRNHAATSYVMLASCLVLVTKLGNMPALGVLRAVGRFEWSAYLTLSDWGGRFLITSILALAGVLTIKLTFLVAILVGGLANLATVIVSFRGWRLLHPTPTNEKISFKNNELWKYIRSAYGISLCDSVVKEVDSTVIGWLLSVDAVGIYRMSKNFVSLVWRMADPVFLVVMPEFTRLLHRPRKELVAFVKKIAFLLGLCGSVLYVVTVAAMPVLVKVMLGPQFWPVVYVYPIMASYVVVGMPLIWSHALLSAAGRPDIQLRANFTGNLTVIVLILVLTPIFGVAGAAAGYSLGIAVLFTLSCTLLWRYMKGYKWVEPSMVKVCVIVPNENKSWIIEKMAEKLAEHVTKFGFEPVLDNKPRPDVALNHWMLYTFANEKLATPSTMLITHIDDPYKRSLVKAELEKYVDLGICMSSNALEELVQNGAKAESLTYILPAHDFAVKPRRIVLGFTTRLYPDGRKREDYLLRLARELELNAFRFDIFGDGWADVVPQLEAAGAEVRYFPGSSDYLADYKQMVEAIPHFDYYVYLGMDEGALGTLDALAAGVKTITTPQGFHVDLPEGITHPVKTYDDFKAVISDISAGWHARIKSVSDLTWEHYARRHAIVWQAVLDGRKSECNTLLGYNAAPAPGAVYPNQGLRFQLRRLSLRRLRAAVSHLPLMKPFRGWVKRHLVR